MEITRGCVTVLIMLQRVMFLPLQFFTNNMELREKQSFFKHYSRSRKIWKVTKICITCWALFSAIRIKFLIHRWKQDNNMEQLCIYTILLCITSLAIVAINTLECTTNELAFGLTQSLKIVKFYSIYHSRRRLPDMKELFVLGFCGTCVIVSALIFTGFPLLLNYHPLSLILKWVLGPKNRLLQFEYILGILSSIVYSALAIQGGGSILFLLMTILSFAEAMFVISYKLLSQNRSSLRSFWIHLRLYRQMKILVREGNKAVADFLQALLILGVLMASCSGYVVVKLYGNLPFILYLLVTPIFPACVSIRFALFMLASIPAENATKFRCFWRDKLRRKSERLQLLSCSPIGYAFGFIRFCHRRSALSVSDVEVNAIASLALMRLN